MPGLSASLDILGKQPASLLGLQRGIEKESLRVRPDGNLSLAPHPAALGSPLTHGIITTDFSESQLELITGVHTSATDCLRQLEDIHAFVYRNIGDELLWPSSMPCLVGEDAEIPIGQYGTSNIGRVKHVYRRGLGLRYGRLMQTISGIHYNFSIPEPLWQALGITDQDAITDAYFSLIRNFRRWSWLLIYLYGASPAVCRSFTRNLHLPAGADHGLDAYDDGTQFLPWATSLRMGPLGYQSSAQSALHISYNSLGEYTNSMVEALTTQYPEYAAHGVQRDGEYLQLNTSILQIENEFYGTIRPKRTIHPGERPVTALRARGVEYVEVRCVDLNPFLPVGIDVQQAHFLDTFLLMCLLSDSPPDSLEESQRMGANQLAVVQQGRKPDLQLRNDQDQPVTLTTWAQTLLEGCAGVAGLLDTARGDDACSSAVQTARDRVADPSLTPSAQVLAQMREDNVPFFRFSMNRAEALRDSFTSRELDAQTAATFAERSTTSIQRQREIEDSDAVTFDEFLQSYLAIPG